MSGGKKSEPVSRKLKEKAVNKERDAVYLKDYLKFPYRKIVANTIEDRYVYEASQSRISAKNKTDGWKASTYEDKVV